MPVVNLPDGTKINFPDGTPEDEMASIIEGALGGENFPAKAAGMTQRGIAEARSKDDAFGNYLRQQAMKPKPGETEEQRFRRLYGSSGETSPPSRLEGIARAGLQGMTFGAGDEIVAAGAAALDPVIKGSGGTLDERYGNYLSREREKIGQFRESNPIAAYGSEIAGAIPTAVLTAPASAPARTGSR